MDVTIFLVVPALILALGGGFFLGVAVLATVSDDSLKKIRVELEDERARRRMAEADVNYHQDQANHWRRQYFTAMMGRTGSSGGSGASHHSTPPPRPSKYGKGHWRTILGLGDGKVTKKDVQTRYVKLAMKFHPDKGGDTAKMAIINAAREQAMMEVA